MLQTGIRLYCWALSPKAVGLINDVWFEQYHAGHYQPPKMQLIPGFANETHKAAPGSGAAFFATSKNT